MAGLIAYQGESRAQPARVRGAFDAEAWPQPATIGPPARTSVIHRRVDNLAYWACVVGSGTVTGGAAGWEEARWISTSQAGSTPC
jgi:hypothetical protein